MEILSDDFYKLLNLLGFNDLGSSWYANEDDTIRIRLWCNNEAIFWDWRGDGNEYNEVRFKGKIKSDADVGWILERCF
tara:strand:+ start:26163 stop:26396 length:234 start_codon:yes stop_codon:yes gene_type:complete